MYCRDKDDKPVKGRKAHSVLVRAKVHFVFLTPVSLNKYSFPIDLHLQRDVSFRQTNGFP